CLVWDWILHLKEPIVRKELLMFSSDEISQWKQTLQRIESSCTTMVVRGIYHLLHLLLQVAYNISFSLKCSLLCGTDSAKRELFRIFGLALMGEREIIETDSILRDEKGKSVGSFLEWASRHWNPLKRVSSQIFSQETLS